MGVKRLGLLVALLLAIAALGALGANWGTQQAGAAAPADARHHRAQPRLVHWDVDASSEDAAGNHGGALWGWDGHHDFDDATGSLHRACVVATWKDATDADVLDTDGVTPLLWLRNIDNDDLTWNILTTWGSPTVNNLKKITGPHDLPCVEWASAQPGAQTITATYLNTKHHDDNMPLLPDGRDMRHDPINIYWDGADHGRTPSYQPLIKEWNTIDSTKIVVVGGLVGGASASDIWDNTAELDNWVATGGDLGSAAGSSLAEPPSGLGYPVACVRDNDYSALDSNCLDRANQDGLTISVSSVLVNSGGAAGMVWARSRSFLDYTLGSHANGPGTPAGYNGPIDGAWQRYTVSGSCGSAAVENPVTGDVERLSPGDYADVLSSDKGVGFTISPTWDGRRAADANDSDLDCHPGDYTTVTIQTHEAIQLRSDVDGAPDETITIIWVVPAPGSKQPLLAWAGQRVVLEHSWRQPGPSGLSTSTATGVCPFPYDFDVTYAKQAQGPGQFVQSLVNLDGDPRPYEDFTPDQVTVHVDGGEVVNTERREPNSDCVSTAMYESQDPGEVDISAYVTWVQGRDRDDEDGCGCHTSVESQQVDFLIYYMKLESVTVGIVDGNRQYHNAGDFITATGNHPFDATKDKTSTTTNVSADVLVRARVKGWFTTTNPTGREAGKDSNNGALPAGRWVMPDDWQQLAGGTLATSLRPNYDIMTSPTSTAYSCSRSIDDSESTPWNPGYTYACSAYTPALAGSGAHQIVEGPFSLIDGANQTDSRASEWDPNQNIGAVRQTWLKDLAINSDDAPMPVSQLAFNLTGAGYLKWLSPVGSGVSVNGGADKFGVYKSNPFYQTNVPAEPWITSYNSDGQGYLWDTFRGSGLLGGVYDFWFDVAARGSAVYSANAKDPAKTAAGTALLPKRGSSVSPYAAIGWTSLTVYTDNHGEAMVYVNGDAGLTMDQCSDQASKDANGIVSLTGSATGVAGDYCEKGDKVGASKVSATADYPDKRKHYPLASNEVSIDWTWGGIKQVTLEPGEAPQFTYVVIHIKDRDGYCALPTVQANAYQVTYPSSNSAGPTGTATTETFPLYVRTSSTQPLVTSTYSQVIISGPLAGIVLTGVVPAYAGPMLPSAVAGVAVYGYDVFGVATLNPAKYSATTTNTGYPWLTYSGTYSLHQVLGEPIDFQLDVVTGGSIVATSAGAASIGILGQSAKGIPAFDTADPNNAAIKRKVVEEGECQAWIKVSNSLLGIGNVLVTAPDPEGTVTFDRILDFSTTTTYTLSFRWSLVTWPGADRISVSDALKGTGKNADGDDIFDQVTAVYGWDAPGQKWLGFFASGVAVPGANDLTSMDTGSAYWVAIKGPGSLPWKIATNVD